MFEHARAAIVRVEGADRLSRLSGTGFFVDGAGTLYTSYSVGGESRDLRVRYGGRTLPARRLFADARSGIALLKVEAQTPCLPMAENGLVEVATPVVAIGYALDFDIAPSFGLVAGRDLRAVDRFFHTTHLRANLPVQRGQGGAPLLGMDGRVIGIVVSSLKDGAGCFALPIHAAERVRREYVRTGTIQSAWVGVEIDSDHPADPSAPARIRHLPPEGPGASAGLQVGDIVLEVGAVAIRKPIDILDASFFLSAGEPTPIRVLRDGREMCFEVKPIPHPTPSDPPRDGGTIRGQVVEGPKTLPGDVVPLPAAAPPSAP